MSVRRKGSKVPTLTLTSTSTLFLFPVLIMPVTRPTTKAKTNAAPPLKGKASAQKSKPVPNSKKPASSSAPKSKKKNQDGGDATNGLSVAEAKLLKGLQAKLNASNAKAKASLQEQQDESE